MIFQEAVSVICWAVRCGSFMSDSSTRKGRGNVVLPTPAMKKRDSGIVRLLKFVDELDPSAADVVADLLIIPALALPVVREAVVAKMGEGSIHPDLVVVQVRRHVGVGVR